MLFGNKMISVTFSRDSVCMGDDVESHDWTVELLASASFGEVMQVVRDEWLYCDEL